MYTIDARKTERAFIRKLQKKGGFTTANGKANLFAGKDAKAILLKTEKSKKPLAVLRTKLRAAISYTFYSRTVTRKELEAYSRFSSALLGILIEVFEKAGKLHKTAKGLLRLTLIGVRYFFAGVDKSVRDLEVAAANGAKFVLMTYAHIRKGKAWKNHVERLGLKIMLDSGAFTLWKAQQKGKLVEAISIADYAAFIEEHKDLLYSWFNLDVIGDVEASKANAEYLKAKGLAPIEVWHIQSSLDDLQQLVDEDHAVIAIGGSVGTSEKVREEIFTKVFERFPDQNFHFLGGSSKLLYKFSWFSADSTGWLAGRMYGAILDKDGQRKAPEGMTGIEALAYNAKNLSSLEAWAA
jgi:hypothetical protein